MIFLPPVLRDLKETVLRENGECGGESIAFQESSGPSALALFPDFPKLQFLT